MDASQFTISIYQPGAPTRLELRISCKQLDWLLASLAQICTHFSPFLLRVEDLGISMTTRPPSLQGDVGGDQWVEFIRSFGSAKHFRVARKLATSILPALGSADADGEHTILLPALRTLLLPGADPTGARPLEKAVESFTNSRRLSGSPIGVYPPHMRPRYACTLCNDSFMRQQRLNRHMRDKHSPRNICQFCDSFEWPSSRRYLFQGHLERCHPRASLDDSDVL